MRNTSARSIALGGVLASLALLIMCLIGFIPAATYVCPMLCGILGHAVLRLCGRSVFFAWFGAVALLSLLMGPDKEAAVIFLFLGWYPAVKPRLDRAKAGIFWKLLLFNTVTALTYCLLIYIMGLQALLTEFRELGLAGMVLMLALANLTFFLFDKLLGRLDSFHIRKQ